MAKHGWNSLQNYLNVHEKTLRRYEKYMERVKTYHHEKLTDFHHTLTCDGIIFRTYRDTRVRVDIEKDIEVDPRVPQRPQARTYSYKYSANQPGGKKLIRYCSPHDDWEEEGSAPHHKHHHKHDFTGNPKGDITLLGNDDWPHVGEFIEEVLSLF
jgi:hypothetical protein